MEMKPNADNSTRVEMSDGTPYRMPALKESPSATPDDLRNIIRLQFGLIDNLDKRVAALEKVRANRRR